MNNRLNEVNPSADSISKSTESAPSDLKPLPPELVLEADERKAYRGAGIPATFALGLFDLYGVES